MKRIRMQMREWKWIVCGVILMQFMIPSLASVNAAQDSGRLERKSAFVHRTLLPEPVEIATPSNVSGQPPENLAASIAKRSQFLRDRPQSGDLWTDWAGETHFPGDGDEEAPYQISTLSQLMGLSEDVANGNSYEGMYIELTQDIDLGGLSINNGSWNPIGWYQDEEEMKEEVVHGFKGNFDGREHQERI